MFDSNEKHIMNSFNAIDLTAGEGKGLYARNEIELEKYFSRRAFLGEISKFFNEIMRFLSTSPLPTPSTVSEQIHSDSFIYPEIGLLLGHLSRRRNY